MEYSRIKLEVNSNKVAHLQLSQPEEYNRMPPAFWQEFPHAIKNLDSRGDIRCLVISSTGKHFTAGMDTSVFTTPRQQNFDKGRQGLVARQRLAELQQAFSLLEQVRMPVIAAVQGGCIGAGLDMISACDFRYCSSNSFFCIQEINIGLAADVGTLQRLPDLIPAGMMRELAYTGRRLSAAEAKEIGLVNKVFDDQDSMLTAVLATAADIATKSPLAIASTKHVLNYGRDHSIDETLQYQQLYMGAISQGGEMADYFGAKSEGNEPQYQDLPPLE